MSVVKGDTRSVNQRGKKKKKKGQLEIGQKIFNKKTTMVSGEKVRKKMLRLGKSRDKDYLRIALIPCQTLRRGNLKGHQHFMSIHS